MDPSFLIAVAVALGLVSLMVVARLGAGAGRLIWPLAELWLVVALWVAFFWWLSSAIAPASASGGAAELRELPSRLARLTVPARLGAALWLAVSVAALAHLLRSLRRIMGHPAG